MPELAAFKQGQWKAPERQPNGSRPSRQDPSQVGCASLALQRGLGQHHARHKEAVDAYGWRRDNARGSRLSCDWYFVTEKMLYFRDDAEFIWIPNQGRSIFVQPAVGR